MNEDVQILKEIEKAVSFCTKHYTKDEIFKVLKVDSQLHPEFDIEKQICILKLNEITSQEEAHLLIYHLTNHHGLIREACASKVNEFFKNPDTKLFFRTREVTSAILQAINDVNPNVCRTIIDIVPLIYDRNGQKGYFLDNLYYKLGNIFEQLELLKRSNMYTKKLFNLYWCLEALSAIEPYCDDRLEEVLKECLKIRDYTIREKTAMLLCGLTETSEEIEYIKQCMRRDINYYVRRYSGLW